MKNIFKRLSSDFSPKQKKNCVQITIPLVVWTSNTLLDIRIKPSEFGYKIYCPTNVFLEANAQGNQEYYFNIFEKHDKNYHFDIKIQKGIIYKDYTQETNLALAINEFIRFYVMLDDFITKHNVIGNEENFA
jgi:hypothetical protein